MESLQEDDEQKKKKSIQQLTKVDIKVMPEPKLPRISHQKEEAIKELLEPGKPVSEIPQHIRDAVFTMNLSYWGVPLSRLGVWMKKSKSTIYVGIMTLVVVLWSVLKPKLQKSVPHAPILYIDEKWIKIKKKWHYWFVAIDAGTGIPVCTHLLGSTTSRSCRFFLISIKRLSMIPIAIVTDGLLAYPSAIRTVFHKARHVLCLFHYQLSVTRWLKVHNAELPHGDLEIIRRKMKRVVQTHDTRTLKRRLDQLEREAARRGWKINSWILIVRSHLPSLISSIRNNQFPSTTNTIERFFRHFQRFYKTRCGFHSVSSARLQLSSFLICYLFSIQVSTGKAPIESIFPDASDTPLYQLLNNPFAYRSSPVDGNLNVKRKDSG